MILSEKINETTQFKPIKFKNFILLDRLGTGGMAEVFLAITSDQVKRLVVIKKPHPHLLLDSAFVNMFRNEIKITANLRNENIAYVNSYDADAEYIELEYIKGISLNDILIKIKDENLKVPIEVTLSIILEVAKALDYIHDYKDPISNQKLYLIHRDISPHNIMIGSDGKVKVIDFGIAKTNINISHTLAGTVKGKYNYISPEQCISGQKVDQRSDLFSLGMVFFEMLTLKFAFKSISIEHYISELQDFKPIEPKNINSEVPEEISKICYQLIQPDPNVRIQKASQLISLIINYLKQQGIRTHLKKWIEAEFSTELNAIDKNLNESIKNAEAIMIENDKTHVIANIQNSKNLKEESLDSESKRYKLDFNKITFNRKYIFAVLPLAFFLLLTLIIKKDSFFPPLEKVIKNYIGENGTEVSIVKLINSDNHFLIYFNKSLSSWNEKSIDHTKLSLNFNEKYITQRQGKSYATIVFYGDSEKNILLYLPEVPTEKLRFDIDNKIQVSNRKIWNSQLMD